MGDPYAPEAIGMYQRQAQDVARWNAAAAGQPPPVNQDLPISQLIQYQQGKTNAQLAYETGQAQNEYNRGTQQARYSNYTLPNLTRKFDQEREKLPGGFAGRGLLNSGIWLDALGKYNTNREFGLGSAGFEQQAKMGQFDINQQNLARTYYNAVAQINQQESAARQDLASQIRAFA